MDMEWDDGELSSHEDEFMDEDVRSDEDIEDVKSRENIEFNVNIPKKRDKKRQSGPQIPKTKLDLTRILGDKGFRFLLSKAENYFEFRGKNYEASDLSKVISLYQEWIHALYPRFTFYDVVKTVEKKCHSKLAQICMRQWHDHWQHGSTLFDLVTMEQQQALLNEPMSRDADLNDSMVMHDGNNILTEEQLLMIEERRMAAIKKLESKEFE